MTDHRMYPRLPDPKYLTPRILELQTEVSDLLARARTAALERDRLATEAIEDEARAADTQAAAAAIRAGKPASSVGTPAMDQLLADQADAEAEAAALLTAARQAEADQQAEFVALASSDKTNGVATMRTAETRYRKAIDTLADARVEWLDARAIVSFIYAASEGSNNRVQADALNTATAGVVVNRIPNAGDQVANLRPMSAQILLTSTFGLDLNNQENS